MFSSLEPYFIQHFSLLVKRQTSLFSQSSVLSVGIVTVTDHFPQISHVNPLQVCPCVAASQHRRGGHRPRRAFQVTGKAVFCMFTYKNNFPTRPESTTYTGFAARLLPASSAPSLASLARQITAKRTYEDFAKCTGTHASWAGVVNAYHLGLHTTLRRLRQKDCKTNTSYLREFKANSS